MTHARFTALFVILLLSASLSLADIPPDPGFKRVHLDIVLDPQEDFTDYRFFIKSGDLAQEVFVKKGEKTTVNSFGGGARYRSSTLLAVPKKNLTAFGEKPDGDQLKAFQSAVVEGKIPGIIKLFDHGFIREVRESEANKLQNPVYRLERTKDGGITATQVAGSKNSGTSNSRVSFGVYDISKSLTLPGWITLIGGSLLSVAIVITGIAMFRRSKKVP